MNSLKWLREILVNRSVYFFWKYASKSSSVHWSPYFFSLHNFLLNLNGFLSKVCQVFLFLLSLLPLFFPLQNDKDPFFYFDQLLFYQFPLSSGISLNCFFRSLCSTLSHSFYLCYIHRHTRPLHQILPWFRIKKGLHMSILNTSYQLTLQTWCVGRSN